MIYLLMFVCEEVRVYCAPAHCITQTCFDLGWAVAISIEGTGFDWIHNL